MTEIDVRAFDQYEAAGWELVAAVYERVWSPITRQAVDPLLDAAVGNIVIQHVSEPERAAGELARVLAQGGRVALSTWDAPERSPFFAALLGAIADAQVPPPLLRGPTRRSVAIGESLDARLEEWRRGDRYLVPAPVTIASGRKPD